MTKITIFESGLIESFIVTGVLSSPAIIFFALRLWFILLTYFSLLTFCLVTVIIHFRFNTALIKGKSRIDTLLNKKVKKYSDMEKHINSLFKT